MTKTLAGKCFCGAVQYTLPDEFRYAMNCHCSNCRRTTGSAFKPFAGIERGKLQVTKGEDKIATYHKTEVSYRKYCTVCGGHLMTNHPPLGVVDVFTATIPTLSTKPRSSVFFNCAPVIFSVIRVF